ncbi:glycosyltransferase 87 family protein [Xylanibacter caecicola]|uniref:glycosyltransferase 87 family protein n=1 Tax=Xylanibacter caecicola TaxID=2736294 RepID=UPI002590FF1B|nr:glycosyltransferase 87 family protein [Xylanibacter caecicola]
MKHNSNLTNKLSGYRHLPFIVYILFATVFLGIQMFQGLSYLDIGFYMSGYQHFREETVTVYFLGQWLMTFLSMSALCDLLSINTYMGLRIMHLIFVISFQTIIYLYLKRFIRRRYILLGLLLATFSHFESYTEINYNDLSIGLLTIALIAYHHGMTRIKPWFIILSGICAGCAFLFRITNLTFLGIPFLAILISHKQHTSMSAIRQAACFFAGVAGGSLACIGIILAAGMGDVMFLTIKDLAHIGGNQDDPHSIAHIIINIYEIYKEEIKGGALATIIVAIACITLHRTHRLRKPAIIAISLLVIVNMYYWEPVANVTVGICLAALAAALVLDVTDTKQKSLFILSLYIPIIFPIGSNAQVEFFGKDICFMSLPLAINIICNCKSLLRHDMRNAYTRALTVCYISACIGFVFTNIKRPMMEEGNRLQCRYTIDSPLTRGILTTKENADLHNNLIRNVKLLIPGGSYMICSFSTTAISLLDCKPYAVFSTVFTSDSMNKRYIDTAYRHTGRLPYLLTKKQDVGEKDQYVEQCLNAISPYRVIWQDEKFVLKAPINAKN